MMLRTLMLAALSAVAALTAAKADPVGQPPGAPDLTAADVEAFTDGFLPFALARADIAGAVVAVVKDGRVLFTKGYGVADVETGRPVDPERTLFRPGSIAKLLTWIAVMQQVEQGRLDLDTDVNTYLDFAIPDTFAAPITLRHLMTHTAGFEETLRGLIVADGDPIPPLGEKLKEWVPERIFPPGETAAYSNYGTALAGYIVERVSGMSYERYVQERLLGPIGMDRSTTAQPLPPDLAPDMSRGYLLASGPAGGFEMVNPAPPGALSATAGDMSRFMIALLAGGEIDGHRIIERETLQAMWSPVHTPVPGFLSTGLGFYEQSRNGQRIWGHGGDTMLFHSDLHLMVDQGIGLYISLNSTGREGAAGAVRAAWSRQFFDRYFPAPTKVNAEPVDDLSGAAASLAGTYLVSRRGESSFLKFAAIVSQATLAAHPDGTISIDMMRDMAGNPKRWRPVAPGVWHRVGGTGELRIITGADGRVREIATDDAPPLVAFRPAPAAVAMSWNLPLLGATVAVALLTVIAWPVSALIRRRYGVALGLSGAALWRYRAVRLGALCILVFLGGWAVMLATAIPALMAGSLDGMIRLVQLSGLLALLAGLLACRELVDRLQAGAAGIWARLRAGVIVGAFAATAWFAFGFNLLSPTLAY